MTIMMVVLFVVTLLLAGTVEQDNGQWPASTPEHEDYRIR